MNEEGENVNLKFQLTLNEHQSNENTLNSSVISSPKRSNAQIQPTRWSIPREERRKLVEQMEWRRDEQKRLKRANWLKLDGANEFRDFWREKDFKIEEIDLKLMKLNQKIYEKINNLNMKIDTPETEVKQEIKNNNNNNNSVNASASASANPVVVEDRSRSYEKEKERVHTHPHTDRVSVSRDRVSERTTSRDYDHDYDVRRDREYDKRTRVVHDNHRTTTTSTSSSTASASKQTTAITPTSASTSSISSNIPRKPSISTYPPPANFFIAFEFDYLELLLKDLSLSRHVDLAQSASFLLKLSENMFMSDRRLFYHQLLPFPDQPNFFYYNSDDDGRTINSSKDFEGDALDLYSQRSHGSHGTHQHTHTHTHHRHDHDHEHVKFYKERALRHRFISTQPTNFFLSKTEIEDSLKEVEFLCKKSEDFSFWFNRIILNRHSIFITSAPLLKAFALLLVLSASVSARITPLSLSKRLWCNKKFGDQWTLKEIKHYYNQVKNNEIAAALAQHHVDDPVRIYFWSANESSKMSKEADYQEFPLFIFRQTKLQY